MFRGLGVQGFRGSGVQGFRGSGVQECRWQMMGHFKVTGLQCYRYPQNPHLRNSPVSV